MAQKVPTASDMNERQKFYRGIGIRHRDRHLAMNRIMNYVEKERRKTIEVENSTFFNKMMNGR